ncbi:hypothetical protein KVK26_03355 [Helicobacter pylori]|uniref:hypothetical protein n=1 Tax=Helicobacter pylori TaxID=210 RepID=UPI00040CAC81|nr:hypothetical protein [Helicobacter pylori]WQU98853.1 hypothetical protein KVK26_03355 [Helicobacter pylori]
MEAIRFYINDYEVKVPFLDTESIKSITPILSAIYKEYTNDTPQAVLIKDYEFIIQDELAKKSDPLKQSIERGLKKVYERFLATSTIEKDNTLLDRQAKNELLNDYDFQSDLFGNALFFFALARYLGRKLFLTLEPPLIVPYSTIQTQA